MIRPISTTTAGLAALLLGAAVTAPAQADPVADFYSGKQITIVIGYSMGGTYGQYATMMARHLQQFIPGKPKLIVQSMPGAGGMKATNYAYNAMVKDGSYLLMPPDSIIISELLTPKSAKYKTNEFTWLGNMIESNSVICVRADAGVKTLADALKKEVVMASTGQGSQTFLIPSTLNGVFGAKFKIIMGYKGSAGSLHAMEQNEVQGVSLTWLAFKTVKPEWFKGDPNSWKAYPIIQVGFAKDKDLPFVQLARDLAKTEDDKKIVDFVASLGPIGRGLATPPGTPKARSMALRAAFSKMIADPAVQADAEKHNLRLSPKSGAEVQAIVKDILTMSPELVKRARAMILGGAKG